MYKSFCLSVSWSVGPLVGWSVTQLLLNSLLSFMLYIMVIYPKQKAKPHRTNLEWNGEKSCNCVIRKLDKLSFFLSETKSFLFFPLIEFGDWCWDIVKNGCWFWGLFRSLIWNQVVLAKLLLVVKMCPYDAMHNALKHVTDHRVKRDAWELLRYIIEWEG